MIWAARGLVGTALLAMSALAVWTWRGWSRPSAVLVAEGFQMVLLAPAWPVLVWCLLAGEWVLAVPAAAVAAAHLAFCLPAIRRDPQPSWLADAPTFSVVVANVRFDNGRVDEVARTLLDVDADVMVVNESTEALRDALAAVGYRERFPTRVRSDGRPFGELLVTVLPARDERVEVLGGQRVPAATVRVGDVDVRVFAVHVNAPKTAAQRHTWRRNLDGLAASASAADGPALYAGDFNSAPWHGPFRRLVGVGLVDAHAALGRGLSRSWTPPSPWPQWLGPVMRLDHALFSDGLWPVRLREIDVPGSDHRGFALEVAVRQVRRSPSARP